MSQPTRADQHLPETHGVDRESSGTQERGDTNSSEVIKEPGKFSKIQWPSTLQNYINDLHVLDSTISS